MKKVVHQMRGVLFSGNANNTTNAGFVYANTNNAPTNTNANIGSQQCLEITFAVETMPQKRPVAECVVIVTGAKNNKCQTGFGKPKG